MGAFIFFCSSVLSGVVSSSFTMDNNMDIYKVLIIGNTGVGKTCILLRYSDGEFAESKQATIGVDHRDKIVNVDGNDIRLQLWDTAGQERFGDVTTSFFIDMLKLQLLFMMLRIEILLNVWIIGYLELIDF